MWYDSAEPLAPKEIPMTDTVRSQEVATLAGGCFWCLEAVYDLLKGVEHVESGYMGGDVANPSYKQICTGTTNHAEVVQITFDPQQISYRDLLDIFFTIHDPTTLNRQGNDVGTQYRSAIFYHSPEQEATAREVIEQVENSGIWGRALVTQLEPISEFYIAEEYHQEYFVNNPGNPYCQVIVAPKVAKARSKFFDKLAK
jgi:peptide-methionine (S)-S-oxide reductase